MNKHLIATFLAFLILGFPHLASAACINPAASEGQMIFNDDYNVPQICTSVGWVALGKLNPSAGGGGCSTPTGVEGQIVYNSAYHTPQYCDGDDWITMIGQVQGCTAPSDCSNVGDTCADGSLFAGFMTDSSGSCDIIYVTDNNQSTSIQYSSVTVDTGADGPTNGRVNTDWIVANATLSDYPAIELCESNTYHGKNDWYLPARAELNLLWLNKAAIDANAAGNFTTNAFWSSTEYGTATAFFQILGDGVQNNANKTTTEYARCIRRVASPGSSGGGGCTAPPSCPNVGDVCDDGNGGNDPDPIFAGFMLYGTSCEPLYVTDDNQSYSSMWKTSTGGDDIATDSLVDGKINDGQIANSTTFPAFKDCKDLTDGGFNDWYLPARDELHLLWNNSAAIGNFTAGTYWSSSEDDTVFSWYHNFGSGIQALDNKTIDFVTRCVRRD